MKHRFHWAAIDPEQGRLIDEMLPVVRAKGDVVGKWDVTLIDPETQKEREAELVGLRYPAGPFGFLCLIVSEGGANEVWAFYPHAEGRRRSTLGVERIEPSENGIEAVIHVNVPGARKFSFSDPLYFMDIERLKEGDQAVFCLSAVAYSLRKSNAIMSLTEGTLFEMMKKGFLEEHPLVDSGEVTSLPFFTAGTACMFPGENAEAQLIFRINDLEYLDCGRPMTRLSGIVMSSHDQAIEVDVYASVPALAGYVPKKWDYVEAYVWMQGVLDQ